MSSKLFRPIIQRVIGQLRFRPTLATYQAAPIIAKKLEDKFDDWNINKYDSVTLYTAKEKKLLEVNYDSITYVNEIEYNKEELLTYISQLYDDYTKSYGIKEIRRIGFRHTQALASEIKYEDILAQFSIKRKPPY